MVGHVSATSITGIIFSLVISVGLPIALFVLAKKKLHAQTGAMGVGVAMFVLAALFLEQILHSIMLHVAGGILQENVWVYALYGGLAAGLFEETGRFVAMKYWMKKSLSKENAIMYGIGHGGVESVLIVGVMTCLNNLISALLINMGQIDQSLSAIEDGPGKELAVQSYNILCTTPGYQFYLAGVERISAIVLQICLSYLIYRGVKYGEKKFLLIAFGIHFLVDAVTVLLSNLISLIVLEAVLLVATGALAVAVKRMYEGEIKCLN